MVITKGTYCIQQSVFVNQRKYMGVHSNSDVFKKVADCSYYRDSDKTTYVRVPLLMGLSTPFAHNILEINIPVYD